MTPLFEACLTYILKIEGGFVNRPEDKGGPTNFGITQATLSAYRGKPVSVDDVKNLTQPEASSIYEKNFWDAMNLDRVKSQKVALFLFDQGVNAGPQTAVRMLQQALSESFALKLVTDGELGEATEAAMALAPEDHLCKALIRQAVNRYVDLCIAHPVQLVFLKGWLARAFNLQYAMA